MVIVGAVEKLEGKSVQTPFYIHQNPRGLSWYLNLASAQNSR